MRADRFRDEIQQALDKIEAEGEIPQYRLSSLQSSIFKKFLGSQNEQDLLHEEAVDRFLSTCDRISQYDVANAPEWLIRYMRAELSVVFSDTNLSHHNLINHGYCGPGASVGVSDDTSFYKKMFDSELTTTSLELYRKYCGTIYGRWLLAERDRAKLHPINVVAGSKLTSVPKDDTKRRTICTEPTLNMFFQLGAKVILNEALRRHHNIDVSKQPFVNKRMARAGSIRGKLCTIDLSEASDSISTSLVKAVLPKYEFDVLNSIRSHKMKLYPNSKFYLELPMFSTMGNGFTFSLMTLLLSSLVRSVYNYHGIHPRNGTNYAVFGDDIIVIDDMFPHVMEALRSSGFIPNDKKTFSEGSFRESCGGDFYKGYLVRGIYCKELKNETHFYSLYNRLLRWSLLSGIDITPVLGTILTGIRNYKFVPRHESSESGIQCPSSRVRSYPRDRNGAIRYRCLVYKTRQVAVEWQDCSNLHGAIICTIGGYIRSRKYSLRCHNKRVKVEKRITPHWDYEGDDGDLLSIDTLTRTSFDVEADRLIRRSFEYLALIRFEALLM